MHPALEVVPDVLGLDRNRLWGLSLLSVSPARNRSFQSPFCLLYTVYHVLSAHPTRLGAPGARHCSPHLCF